MMPHHNPWSGRATRALGILAAIAAFAWLLACNTQLAGGSSSTETGEPVSLTGRVTANGAAVAGVVVSLAKAGLVDTTDALGTYALRGKLAKGASLDTLVFTRDRIRLARRVIAAGTAALPELPVVKRAFSGMLPKITLPLVARLEGVVMGNGIAAGDSAIVPLLHDPVSGSYSGYLYFPTPAEGPGQYLMHVNIYGAAGARIGSSEDVPFDNLAGDVPVPALEVNPPEVNPPAVITGLRDTIVTAGTAVAFSVAATDPDGIASYLWDFNGDGVTDDSTLTGTVSHTFPAVSAAYDVSVSIRDTRGGLTRASAKTTLLTAGLIWGSRPNIPMQLWGVVWTGTQFVAAGISSALTSPDGLTWTTRRIDSISKPTINITDLSFHKGVIYALSPLSEKNLYTSTDGIVWTGHTTSLPTTVKSLHSAGDFLMGGDSGGAVYRSSNGIEWAHDTAKGLGKGQLVAFTVHNGLIVGVGTEGSTATSTNGVDWTVGTNLTAQYNLYAVLSMGTSLVAVGSQGVAAVSENGIDWTPTRAPVDPAGTYLRSIAWSGSALVGIGPKSTMISVDRGLTWSRFKNSDVETWAVAWNGTRFVTVTYSALIYTSPP